MVFFLRVARATERVQVANLVVTSASEGDDVVDSEFCFLASFATALTLVAIALEHVVSHFWGNANARGFHGCYCGGRDCRGEMYISPRGVMSRAIAASLGCPFSS